ncbi:hypothetical protein Godav_002324 [Gossypium davidsonii]|uniref:RNase H type-1 domain-containing protein n=1 Tax=Gossypium davidsonii TaxID=34287 RepID=A0A7J8SVQ9_GOSDV|nr:hypothetical protein [Gossypium davidsonii]
MGLDMGISKVVIEGDNLSMIKKLHARVIKRSVLSAYIINAKKTSEDFVGCMFRHVIRNENELAHILAKKGLRREENTYLLERVPSYTIAATEMDNRRIDQASLSV